MKINIIHQNTLKYRRSLLTRRVNAIVFWGSIGLFTMSVLYLTLMFVYLSVRQNSFSKSVAQLRAMYESRLDEVGEYLVVKQIVAAENELASKRFKYRDFLNGVYKLIPPSSKLVSVDFSSAGVIDASVRVPTLTDYDILTNNLNTAIIDDKFLFSMIAQNQLVREKTGAYLATLELKIK